MNKRKSILFSIIAVLCLIAVVTGVTVSYFLAQVQNNNTIGGSAYNFDVSVSVKAIKTSSALVPVDDDTIERAVADAEGKCVSKEGYDICSLYEVTLTNNGDLELLTGYLETVNSTYTTSNLKYQLLNDSKEKVSDASSINNDSNSKNTFQKGSSSANISLAKGSSKYYLVIWLTNTQSDQKEDQGKVFTGRLVFESINGPKISSSFITP